MQLKCGIFCQEEVIIALKVLLLETRLMALENIQKWFLGIASHPLKQAKKFSY